MSQIARTSSPKVYQDLNMVSRTQFNEANDCAVLTVALVCEVPYSVAHQTLKDCGRKDRMGTYSHQYLAAIKKLGKTLVAVSPRSIIDTYPAPHNTLQGVTSHHPRRFARVWDRSKTYVMRTNSHVFVVKGGETLDWSINRVLRVRQIWEVK